MQVITYEIEGKKVIMVPNLDCGLTVEEIAEKDVPTGVEYTIMESDEVQAEETTDQKLSALDAEYQTQFDALIQALGAATLASDTDLIADLQAEYATLKAEYTTARSVIDNG